MTASDLRNNKQALLRRLQRQVEKQQEKVFDSPEIEGELNFLFFNQQTQEPIQPKKTRLDLFNNRRWERK